ncbi:hypothetical protein HN51_069663 [Arachis hypogaea]|uniref:ZF-HD dimerization-type domain-containing protein n=1 Tax=Arachis hypogaea TaxID=3818 RepID=A0A444Z4X5_ARAHY|nr:zinc-finger homeodomain protein 8-like [Arachis ipaensis]XP_025654857.1 zinc-finger homeodomain protein 8 [Arachis hypogaea]QHO12036.1 Zinc-finger homeodomain protein [Arachis hypogaea]RYR09259.1 hypothetical protein Ahy_B05g077440 isoform D [Arachis hypogaea]
MDLTPIDASTTHTQTQTQTIEHTNSQQTQTPPPPTTNGSLKRHHPLPATAIAAAPPLSMVISYKECLKNHAATIGGHALDGCGEFMPSSSSNPSEPRSLTCAACGCHRNFHRRDPESLLPHHHHHPPNFLSFYHHSSSPPLPQRGGLSLSTSPSTTSPSPSPSASPISSPSSPPPAPLSHHFPPPPPYSSFHHHHMNNNSPSTVVVPNMLLSLGNAACSSGSGFNHQKDLNSSKKRHRTKFSKEQKEKMLRFSEKLGWRMQRDEDGLIQEFCNQIGVSRGVFKVWMHNNKNTFFRNRNNNNNDNASAAEKNGSLNGVHNGNHIDNDNDDDHNNNDNGNGNQHSNNTSSSNDDIQRDY